MRYAAYGSNLHPLRLAERTSSARLLGTRFLRHWSLNFHKRGRDNSAKCNASLRTGGLLVAVYELSSSDKSLLDRIEGPGYRTDSMNVPGFGQCFTYLARESHIDSSLTPYDWYKELVLLGCAHFRPPESYVRSISAIDAETDPDAARAQSMWQTVRRIRLRL